MEAIFMQALMLFGPFVMKAIDKYQQRNNTTVTPTWDTLKSDIDSNSTEYLSEIASWRITHPQHPTM